MIIDAHTHRYPAEVISDPIKFAKQRGEQLWLQMVAPQGRPSLQGWAERNRMLADMETAGVNQCVLLGWYWEKYQTCLEANTWHHQWINQDPDKFIGFLSVRPDIPNLADYLKQAKEDGFKGIGESHPWAQGFSLRDKKWLLVMEFASEAGWPVNFHVTDPSGRDHPGKTLTPMEEFLWLAKEFPDLKIILAHAGALFPIDHPTPPNIYYDLAACPLLYDAHIYQKLIDCAGQKKIIWGSDYPLRIYPAISSQPDFLSFLKEFKSAVHLDEEQLENVLGKNIENLLK